MRTPHPWPLGPRRATPVSWVAPGCARLRSLRSLRSVLGQSSPHPTGVTPSLAHNSSSWTHMHPCPWVAHAPSARLHPEQSGRRIGGAARRRGAVARRDAHVYSGYRRGYKIGNRVTVEVPWPLGPRRARPCLWLRLAALAALAALAVLAALGARPVLGAPHWSHPESSPQLWLLAAHTPVPLGRARALRTPGRLGPGARARVLGCAWLRSLRSHPSLRSVLGQSLARPIHLAHDSSSWPHTHPCPWVAHAHSWSHPHHWPRVHACLWLPLAALAALTALSARPSPGRAPLEPSPHL